jgi:hypothetical protein
LNKYHFGHFASFEWTLKLRKGAKINLDIRIAPPAFGVVASSGMSQELGWSWDARNRKILTLLLDCRMSQQKVGVECRCFRVDAYVLDGDDSGLQS